MDTTSKEKVLNQLEQVFNIAVETYVSTKGRMGNIKEIESLGETILTHHKILMNDVEKTKRYIDATVEVAVRKQVGGWCQDSDKDA